MNNMFSVYDIIENIKTGKIGKVIKVYEDVGIFKYHLLKTPNNVHTGFIRENRFKLRTNEMKKIYLRILLENGGDIIMEYSDNQHLFQACAEYDENNIRWEFVTDELCLK